MGVKRILGFVRMEFMVVHVVVDAHVLIKSTSLVKAGSLQLCLLWSAFSPRARGVACPRCYGL